MWACPKCNEEIEDQFDSCWRCAGPIRSDVSPAAESGNHFQTNIDVILEGVLKVRRRRTVVWVLLGLFLPVSFLAGWLFGDTGVKCAASLFGVLYVTAVVRLHAVRCPRCGELFHLGLSPWLAMRGRCWNCRLALDEYVP